MSGFTSNDPPIPGLDESIVILPRRLHLTLGVMALKEDSLEPLSSLSTTAATSETPKTLSMALVLFTSLNPRIFAVMDGQPLRLPLEVRDIMRPHRGWATNAHVMFDGPDESEENRKLRAVCGACLILFCNGRILISDPYFSSGYYKPRRSFRSLIHLRAHQHLFIQAGPAEDEHRPLKLHCMLLNTVYRRQRAREKAGSACLRAILASDAFKQISVTRPPADAAGPGESPIAKRESATASPSLSTGVTPSTSVERPNPRATQNERGHRIELGGYNVDEVQICLMGSSGPEGEYVSVGVSG